MKIITIKDDGKTKTSELMALLKKKFDVWSYWDQDLDKNFPVPEKPTSRKFKLEKECTDLKGQSRNDMEKHSAELMTLREYILYFEAYYEQTEEHIDKDGWTIFQDRLPDGGVACGRWYPHDRDVGFSWYGADRRCSSRGARLAISLNSSKLVPLPLETRVKVLEEQMESLRKFLIF